MAANPQRRQPVEMQPGWVQGLLEQIRCTDAEYPPPNAVKRGEKEIGICTPYMKQLFSLARFYDRESNQLDINLEQAKLDASGQDEQDSEAQLEQAMADHRTKHAEMIGKYNLLMALFWGQVRGHFNMWGQEATIGVRKGWKIVKTAEDDSFHQHGNPFESLRAAGVRIRGGFFQL